jgi:hypothetical protein
MAALKRYDRALGADEVWSRVRPPLVELAADQAAASTS